MFSQEQTIKQGESTDRQIEVLAEDNVRKAFGAELRAPVLKTMETGFINPLVTYELVFGKAPHTKEDFYSVNISLYRPGKGVDNWLMSSVFWTEDQAKSYIHYLQSERTSFSKIMIDEQLSP